MKVPFEIVDLEVAKMYDGFSDTENFDQVDWQCQKIVKFLHSCGWSEDEYLARLLELDKFN